MCPSPSNNNNPCKDLHSLYLYLRTYTPCKEPLRGDFWLKDVVFRCAFYLSFHKNMDDPYYEPTIMVHNNLHEKIFITENLTHFKC